MSIISYLDLFLGALLNAMFNIVVVKKVFRIKIIKERRKVMFTIIMTAFVLTIINIFNKNTFKALLTFPVAAVSIYIIFDKKITSCIYYTLILSFYLLIGDMIIGIVFPLLNLRFTFLETNILGRSLGNVLVILITIPLIYFKPISRIFIKIHNHKFNLKTIIISFFIFLVIGSAFVFKSSKNIDDIISIIMNFIIFSVFIIFIYFSYTKSQQINQISFEYNSLLNYLDKYEKEIVEKRKLIHDFKNQLIVINGYAENNPKLKEYLNSLIEEHKNIKETKVVRNIDKLPKGLKGLIYYKLSQIDDKTNIVLNVNSKYDSFEKLTPKDNRNLLKIVGILIDNAIESLIETKEKYLFVDIEINKEKFKMQILNSYIKKIEKVKIMELGISTKGKNRGYGLALAKDIISNNGEKYKLNFDVEDNLFKTDLVIRIK